MKASLAILENFLLNHFIHYGRENSFSCIRNSQGYEINLLHFLMIDYRLHDKTFCLKSKRPFLHEIEEPI